LDGGLWGIYRGVLPWRRCGLIGLRHEKCCGQSQDQGKNGDEASSNPQDLSSGDNCERRESTGNSIIRWRSMWAAGECAVTNPGDNSSWPTAVGKSFSAVIP
jgi:hypothetical protein